MFMQSTTRDPEYQMTVMINGNESHSKACPFFFVVLVIDSIVRLEISSITQWVNDQSVPNGTISHN